MRISLPLSLLLLLSVSGRCLAVDGIYVQADSLSYSEPVPVSGFFHDWHTPFHDGGKRALTYNYAEAGVTEGNWQLGVVARDDYTLRFNPDTADLYYRIENHLDFPPGRQYAVDLEARHFIARGLRIGYGRQLRPAFRLGLGLTWLQGTQLLDGTMNGAAVANDSRDYDYDVAVDYRYSKDLLFKRQASPPNGQGFSLDLSADWHPGRLDASLRITDLVGRLYWHDAPYTQADAVSLNKSYDADGYLIINPTLSGIEGNRSFVQRLPTRARLDLRYPLHPALDLLAQVHYTQIRTFAAVGMGYSLPVGGRVGMLYDWDTGAVTLGFQAAHLKFSLSSDRIKWRSAHTLGASLELRYDLK